jgi:anti-anti-sigma regulatory factor
MAKRTSGSKHHLSGDWTISGVADQCEALSRSLQDLESGQKKKLQIDCGKINNIDMSGLQLLHVWMELVRMRGVETRLFNLPDDMLQTIQRLGLRHPFTDNYPDVA